MTYTKEDIGETYPVEWPHTCSCGNPMIQCSECDEWFCEICEEGQCPGCGEIDGDWLTEDDWEDEDEPE